MATKFQLQFSPSEIRRLAERYQYADNSEALRAGERIAAGDDSLANLRVIVAWKSPRSTGLVLENSEGDVRDVWRLATDAATDRAAVAVLLGLRGVRIPVASAILAAINPNRFTIIDYRALEALGS
jgi:hypothetical protein